MNTRPISAPPTPALPAHHALIGAQLPPWLRKVPAAQLKDFRDCLINSNQARHDLKALLGEIQSPEDFARPRLRAALTAQFFTLIDDENAILVRE